MDSLRISYVSWILLRDFLDSPIAKNGGHHNSKTNGIQTATFPCSAPPWLWMCVRSCCQTVGTPVATCTFQSIIVCNICPAKLPPEFSGKRIKLIREDIHPFISILDIFLSTNKCDESKNTTSSSCSAGKKNKQLLDQWNCCWRQPVSRSSIMHMEYPN